MITLAENIESLRQQVLLQSPDESISDIQYLAKRSRTDSEDFMDTDNWGRWDSWNDWGAVSIN